MVGLLPAMAAAATGWATNDRPRARAAGVSHPDKGAARYETMIVKAPSGLQDDAGDSGRLGLGPTEAARRGRF